MAILKRQLAENILPFRKPVRSSIECSDNLEYMRLLQNESMHLIVTSPPYNLGKSYEKKTTNEIYIEQQSATIAEAVRLLHANGSICWQVGNYVEDGEVYPLDILLYQKFKDLGLQLRNRMSGPLVTDFIAKSNSQVDMKPFFGSPNQLTIRSTWTQFVFRRSIRRRSISKVQSAVSFFSNPLGRETLRCLGHSQR